MTGCLSVRPAVSVINLAVPGPLSACRSLTPAAAPLHTTLQIPPPAPPSPSRQPRRDNSWRGGNDHHSALCLRPCNENVCHFVH